MISIHNINGQQNCKCFVKGGMEITINSVKRTIHRFIANPTLHHKIGKREEPRCL